MAFEFSLQASYEIFLLALVHGVLKRWISLEGCVCCLSEFAALGLVGVVGALVLVHVMKDHQEQANEDQD